MKESIYKFEQYPNRNFPIYSSIQEHQDLLITPHFHDDMEFIFVRSGEVMLSIGTEKYCIGNNEIIYISPNTVHQATSNTANASLRGLVFHPSILKPYFTHEEFYSFSGSSVIYSKESPYYDEFAKLFKNISNIYDSNPFTYKIDLIAHILMLISALIRSDTAFCKVEDDNYSRIKPAIEYIEENFRQKIYISDLSRLVNTCDDHFIRMFKTATSRTPIAYITDIRLHQALRLLSLNKYSISEVAEMTGFSNVQYFSGIFKNRLGSSPSAYRKAILCNKNIDTTCS